MKTMKTFLSITLLLIMVNVARADYALTYRFTCSNGNNIDIFQNSSNTTQYTMNYGSLSFSGTVVDNGNSTSTLSFYNSLNVLVLQQVIPTGQSVPDGCANLGGLRNDETYGDCFKRNVNNFCCSFLMCAAWIANPIGCSVAIGIACLTGDDIKLTNLYNYATATNYPLPN